METWTTLVLLNITIAANWFRKVWGRVLGGRGFESRRPRHSLENFDKKSQRKNAKANVSHVSASQKARESATVPISQIPLRDAFRWEASNALEVHPPVRVFCAFIFPAFSSGCGNALRSCLQETAIPDWTVGGQGHSRHGRENQF